MPRPFHEISLEEFSELLARFTFRRRINAVHMHHTWKPTRAQYRGLETIEGMWRHHTQVNGWSDIAQHITIAPDGKIWTGRDWNRPPASAGGHNGNAQVGPFMFEMIGDFDTGREAFDGRQREVALQVVARVQKRFNLSPETLRFHNQMSTKTCPGSAVSYPETLEAVRRLHAELEREGVRGDRARQPFDDAALDLYARVEEVLRTFTQASELDETALNREALAEPQERESSAEELAAQAQLSEAASVLPAPDSGATRARGELSPSLLHALRPHVINLNQGRFSGDGIYRTEQGEVDAIFEQHLEEALAEARQQQQPLRILFYAHGGLVSEASGLQIAHNHTAWWKRNHIYPIHFIWETGLFETIGQLLRGARQRTARDIFDFTTDPILEKLARALGGEKIWSGIKRSAELGVREGNGALYAARKLQQFCHAHAQEVNDGQLELHAIGHSAGSNFHSHFLPTALDLGVPSFRSVHFLAPAINVESFHERLGRRLGQGLEHLTIFTMARDWEEQDHCAHLYRKSLLYLLHRALEANPNTPLLGLEISLRGDARLRRMFGLDGQTAPHGEVVWSVSRETEGRNASQSQSHGGFDNDPATMDSLARRVLGEGRDDQLAPFAAEVGATRSLDPWITPPLPEELTLFTGAHDGQPTAAPVISVTPVRTANGDGRRLALCIGINTYPTAPLAGCVADARLWADTLKQSGFITDLLLNQQATRAAIMERLGKLIDESAPGDVLVFQYAGHGTTLPDLDGDETGGDNGDKDEALCPVDFHTGSFVIDDDLRRLFQRLPDGVNLTCFMDCCHSGTITRVALGASSPQAINGQDVRPRYLPITTEMKQAHQQFRARLGAATPLTRGPAEMKEVVFTACRSFQVAYETDGQGDFTRRVIPLLRTGLGTLAHEVFYQRIGEAFGTQAHQSPTLDCAPAARGLMLLQSRARASATGNAAAAPPPSSASDSVEQVLRLLGDLLRQKVR